jgi:Kef-type K+ transport system membrane component KefB
LRGLGGADMLPVVMEPNLTTLFLIALIAVAAPLVSELPIRLRLPIVVLEIALGIVVGPHVLGWAQATGVLAFLGTMGLGFLFFLAGLELDFDELRGVPLQLGVKSWSASIIIALVLTLALRASGFVNAPIMIATALATSAIGTLLPTLRDSGELETRFGKLVLGAGAVGELGPILVVSLILTREHTTWIQTLLLLAFAAVALAAAVVASKVRMRPIIRLLERTLHASSQLPVRICILLIVGLVALAKEFGLDFILGAFAAGMVVRLASEGKKGDVLREKLDAIGYGFLVPLFFVTSGIKFDLGSLLQSTDAILRVPLYVALFFLVRGTPSLWFYRNELEKGERMPFMLYISTALPLVVAITHIGVATGRMRSENAAALVGAGMLSVLLFPLLALVLRRRSGAVQPGRGRGDEEDAL